VTYLIRPVLKQEPATDGGSVPAWARFLAIASLLLWAAAIGSARMMAL
jgi:hypothetical protein